MHKNKHSPSQYEKVETVIVKITKSNKKLKAKDKHLSKLFSDQEIDIKLNIKLAKVPDMHGFLFQ